MRRMKKLFRLFFLAVMAVVLLGTYGLYYLRTPSDLSEETHVIIRKGTRSQATSEELANAGVIKFPKLFFAIQFIVGNTKKFKAGEYSFPPNITPDEVARKLVVGDVVVHKVTIAEGLNVREVKDILIKAPVLEGDISRVMPEGSLLPETYHYTYGDTRDAVIARMQDAMDKTLSETWENRDEGLPFTDKQQALILASIVEKETGLDSERPRVAAVFINRLRKGMRLQTDPSVIYGIEQINNAPMKRPLNLADLETPNNYNTYVIPGLPPTPIANPGFDSLYAVMHPAQTDELYFVAIGDGSGGHRFSSTLEGHNKNVAAYRAALKNAPAH
jgi:UPF0755 protein